MNTSNSNNPRNRKAQAAGGGAQSYSARRGATGSHRAVNSRSSHADVSSGNPRSQARSAQRASGQGRHAAPAAAPSGSNNPRANAAAGTNNPRANAGAHNPRAAAAPRNQTLPVMGREASHVSNSVLENQAVPATKRKRGKAKKIALGVLAAVLVVCVVGIGAAFAYINKVQGNMQEGISAETLAALDNVAVGDPFYMLLMGTDGSDEREASGDFGDSFRTDSMMLLRVDPQEKKVACVSIMRDTQVEIEGYGLQKINAAHVFGGAELAIKTVSELAGVPISHYAEIDFDGFEKIVDALGGIEVNVPVAINDKHVDAVLEPGLQTLNGVEALSLGRSRHTYDNIGSGDALRAANQRMVLGAIAKKILAADVPTMMSSIEALSQYVTTDMSVTDILALAQSMRGMSMEDDFYTAICPTISDYSGGIWWEKLQKHQWEEMMERIDKGLPPTEGDEVDEATGIVISNAGGGAMDSDTQAETTAKARKKNHSGSVAVRNGTTITGLANKADAVISDLGFQVNTGNANSTDYDTTVVVYNDDDRKEDAEDIVAELGVGTIEKNNSKYLFDGDLLVVLGTDYDNQ